jgi:gamma-glutamylputrescine oxidase
MTVGWDEDPAVEAWPGLPRLDGDRTVDACVIGLGGSGLAAVDALAARGLSVIGVDAGRVAAGAAGRNGGFLLGGAAAFLHTAIGLWGAEVAAQMYRETLAELDRIQRLLGPGAIRRVGSIRLVGLPGPPQSDNEAADRAREAEDCAAHADALHAYGIRVETYDGPLGAGLYLPDDAAMNPAARAVATAQGLVGASAVTLYEHTSATEIGEGRVATPHGVIGARYVVVAVDGGLERVLPQLAGRVRTARLQMLATAPIAAGRLPCPVYGRWGYDYAQQLPDGRLFVGGGRDRFVEQEWTTDATPTAPVQSHIDGVAARMAGTAVSVTHRWAASVGFTQDGRPLCSEIAPGVVAIGGYNGTGNLVGPIAARAAVALLLDGTRPPLSFTT